MKPFAWLSLAAAAHLLAAALSGLAATIGLTDFPNDRRAEWGIIVVPILLFPSGITGWLAVRRLSRAPSYPAWSIALTAGAVLTASLLLTTWRFAHA